MKTVGQARGEANMAAKEQGVDPAKAPQLPKGRPGASSWEAVTQQKTGQP